MYDFEITSLNLRVKIFVGIYLYGISIQVDWSSDFKYTDVLAPLRRDKNTDGMASITVERSLGVVIIKTPQPIILFNVH